MSSAYGRLPLNALRVFEAVATRLSFSEAAEALNVTPAAVSQQIRSLEDYLQLRLFRRSGRKVELTSEGQQLLPGVRKGLDVLDASLREIRLARSAGTLNVSVLASVLQKWLMPRLQRFHLAHPGLQVSWHTSREPVDFARSDFHAAVRFGAGRYAGVHSEHVMDEWFVVVATPALLARHGPIRPDQDLTGFPLLHAKDEPWSVWGRVTAETTWPPVGSSIDDSVSILAAALEGIGYATTRWSLVVPDLEAGRLVLASDTVVPSRWSYWFVCPEPYLSMPKLEALRRWLAEEGRTCPTPATHPAVAAASRPSASQARQKRRRAAGRAPPGRARSP